MNPKERIVTGHSIQIDLKRRPKNINKNNISSTGLTAPVYLYFIKLTTSYIYPEAHPDFLRDQSAHSADTSSSHEPLDGVFGQHRVHVVPQDSPLSHWSSSSSSSYSSRTESKGCRGRSYRAEWSSSRCL